MLQLRVRKATEALKINMISGQPLQISLERATFQRAPNEDPVMLLPG